MSVIATPKAANLLAEQRTEIVDRWMTRLVEDPDVRADLLDAAQLRLHASQIVAELAVVMASADPTDGRAPEYHSLVRMLSDLSASFARRGFTPVETASFVFSLKYVVTEFLHACMESDPSGLNAELNVVNRLIDRMGLLTFQAFVAAREQVIQRQQDELLELSLSVIRMWDNVLVLPIVGVLDSSRALLLTERLLEAIASTGCPMTIIDITGVPTVDTATAQHLMKTVRAVKLMGAECVISGIRPAIATTIVNLGVDMGGIVTRYSMAEALRYCFAQLGLKVISA